MLVESAAKHIRITTPYFLPDKSLRAGLHRHRASAASKIDIIVPGSHTDQRWVRLVSRRKYNELLREGIRIYEYRAGMTHAKVLNVDDLWVVLGTTNFDNRSFEHNDEVNVAIRDEEMAARLTEDFRARSEVLRGGDARHVEATAARSKKSSSRSPGFSSGSNKCRKPRHVHPFAEQKPRTPGP